MNGKWETLPESHELDSPAAHQFAAALFDPSNSSTTLPAGKFFFFYFCLLLNPFQMIAACIWSLSVS